MRIRPSSHKPAGFDLNFKPFNADILDGIVAATLQEGKLLNAPPSDGIIERMNTAAIAHRFEMEQAKSPTERMERAALVKLRKAAQTLHALLPVEFEEDDLSGDQCNPHVADGITRLIGTSMRTLMLQRVGEARAEQKAAIRVEDLFNANSPGDALLLLSDLSNLLAESVAHKLEHGGSDGLPDRVQNANRSFVRSLLGIYEEVFSRPIRYSRNSTTNAPQGPLIRFLSACFDQLPEANPSDESLIRWVQHNRQAASNA